MIILDTNVVFELMRPEPAPQVASFTAFEDQVLPVGTAAADNYAVIASSRERAGNPSPASTR